MNHDLTTYPEHHIALVIDAKVGMGRVMSLFDSFTCTARTTVEYSQKHFDIIRKLLLLRKTSFYISMKRVVLKKPRPATPRLTLMCLSLGVLEQP